MILNSRPNTQNIAFTAELSSPLSNVTDTYSDDLMDDLFLEVDRILEGDLSSYMTVVGRSPKPIQSSTRTVQLPQNFVPRSAADIYRVTMAAANNGGQHYRSSSSQTRHRGYSAGGRPVTSEHTGQSEDFQSARARTIRDTHGPHTAELHRTTGTTIDLHRVDPSNYPIQSVSNYLYPKDPLAKATHANTSPQTPPTIFESQRPQARKQQPMSLPFLLMGAAGISAVSTIGIWTLGQSASGNGWLLSLSREAAAAELPDSSDEDFLVYLQQSLEVISAQEQTANQMLAVMPVVQNTPSLPTTVPNTNAAPPLGALPNLPGGLPTPTVATPVMPAPQVIERVFVPVYENVPATQTAALPNVTMPATTAARPTVPVPTSIAAAAAIPPGAPLAADASVPIVPTQADAALPAPNVAMAPNNMANTAAAITNVSPNSEHILVGILNLGDRSAALFDLDGNPQRAYVGDRIGVSDWTLVSVNGQDVVVRRDGEVRAIYIGQRF